MKRPLAVGSLVFFAATLLAYFCDFYWMMTLLSVALLLAGVSLLLRPKWGKRVTVYLLVAAVGIGLFLLRAYFVYLPVSALDGQTVDTEGMVTNVQRTSNGNYCYTLKARFPNQQQFTGEYQLMAYGNEEEAFKVGDGVAFSGKLRFLNKEDYSYQVSNSVYLSTWLPVDYEITDASGDWQYPLLRARDSMVTSLRGVLKEPYSEIVTSILFSERMRLDDTIYQSFKSSGIVHMTAVSGLHLAILTQLLLSLLSKLRLHKKLSAVLIGVFVLTFMAFIGFTPSVSRAGIMCLVFFGAKLFGRAADSMTSLSVAVLAMLLINPFYVVNASFMLSVGATLSILVFAKPIGDWMKAILPKKIRSNRVVLGAASILSVSLSAQILLLPVMACFFDKISLMGIVTNLFITPILPFLMGLGFFTAVVGLFWLPVAQVVGWLLYPCTAFIKIVSGFLAGNSLTWLPTEQPYQIFWCFSFAALCLFFRYVKVSGKLVATGIVFGAVSLSVGMVTEELLLHQNIRLIAFDDVKTVFLTQGHDAIALYPYDQKGAAGDMKNRLEDASITRVPLALAEKTADIYRIEESLSHYQLKTLYSDSELSHNQMNTPVIPVSGKAFHMGELSILPQGERDFLIEVDENLHLKLWSDYVIIKDIPTGSFQFGKDKVLGVWGKANYPIEVNRDESRGVTVLTIRR